MSYLLIGLLIYCVGIFHGVRMSQKAARGLRDWVYGKDKK